MEQNKGAGGQSEPPVFLCNYDNYPMQRRSFLSLAAVPGVLAPGVSDASVPHRLHEVCPAIWRFTLGTPEGITPVSTRQHAPATDAIAKLAAVAACPVSPEGSASHRGYQVRLPLEAGEIVYGLGLQLQSFMQRGLKKKLRVNADPRIDSGDSHAPVPFYVTTSGYGVLIDSARYITIYCGSTRHVGEPASSAGSANPSAPAGDLLPAAYRDRGMGEKGEVLVEIPEAGGVDVYVFGGPSLREAVQRYNLFSGGGVVPPRWGLGIWYRCDGRFNQQEVLKMGQDLRSHHMPCDVVGLEPGWQTHAYSCSFVWSDKFPNPGEMVRKLGEQQYKVNLWEHAFTHPSSPLYPQLKSHSGDFAVWGGLAPDFLQPEARQAFADFHDREHVALGVCGYKLDECDNSDFTGSWSFPELSKFPSGADGEQMHSLFGLRYADAIDSVYERRGVRTYGLIRSAHALAAPYPYVLYSDLYDHAEFVKGVAKIGFCGLLWTPEVRDAKTSHELIRRLQSVVLSPMALINAWYIRNPPWMQVNAEANNAGQFDPGWEQIEAQCREVMELRMKLVPYLHSAFVRYQREGVPPFRALVMDYPDDARTWAVDDQYMIGESLLAAPVVGDKLEREVYLPTGQWHDFWTGESYAGKQRVKVAAPLNRIPVLVKSGTLLPLAQPTLHTADPASYRLSAHIFGSAPATAVVFEDDGKRPARLTEVRLEWNAGSKSGSVHRAGPTQQPQYDVVEWKQRTT